MEPFLFAYNIFVVPLLWTAFRFGGLINRKIKRGIDGRRTLFTQLEQQTAKLNGTSRIWFHASSLGEFEQAKPIIAAIKQRSPDTDIIATFFSPSGLENSRNYKAANIITYIPFDTPHNVARFLDLIEPDIAIMVRYDIWPNMIFGLKERGIPVVIANATMTEGSLRMLPIFRRFHRTLYDWFTQILTVSENDAKAFHAFRTTRPLITAVGDTRFDQVMMRSNDARQRQLLSDAVIAQRNVFVVGQSWGEDDDVIVPVLATLHKYDATLLTIIVPHEPTIEHLEALESKLEGTISYKRFSEMNSYKGENVILIDSIGVLVALYKYAHVVYIGGSFRQGIHNVLEPAVFGVPVIYGPKHTNSQEAVALAHRGGGFVINTQRELYRTLRTLLQDQGKRTAAGNISADFVRTHCGATERILHHLQPYLK